MDLSTTQAAARLAADFGTELSAATLRTYEELGLVSFRKTPRGERIVREADLPRIARIARERKRSQLAALAAGRAARIARG